jgi:hypothetical protein
MKRVLENNSTLCLAKSIESDLCPVDPNSVRGKIIASGFFGICDICNKILN